MPNVTMLDLAKRLGPDNKVSRIIEMLNQTNEILEDMVTVEGNLPTGHKSVIRTGLPDVAWRKLNYGVQPSKSQTVPVTDECGMLEAYSKVDKDLAEMSGNVNEFRLSEASSFIEAMNQQMAQTIFYGDNKVNPDKFLGLAARYSVLSGAGNSENIINAGGASGQTDCASIWLVCWGDQTVHAIHPKGSEAGLHHKALPEDTLSDGNGGEYQGYRDHFQWKLGLTVKDWRYAVRIANIDVGNLIANSSPADLLKCMIMATEKIPSLGMGKCAFYCNKTIRAYLRQQILNKANVNLTWDTVAGKRVLGFDGIPVRACDALLSTEAALA